MLETLGLVVTLSLSSALAPPIFATAITQDPSSAKAAPVSRQPAAEVRKPKKPQNTGSEVQTAFLPGLDEKTSLRVKDRTLRKGDVITILQSNDFGGLNYVQGEITIILASGALEIKEVANPKETHVILPGGIERKLQKDGTISALDAIVEQYEGKVQKTASGIKYLVGGKNRVASKTDKSSVKVRILMMNDKLVWVSYADNPKQYALFRHKLLLDEIQTEPKQGSWLTTTSGRKFQLGATYNYDLGITSGVRQVKVIGVAGNQVVIENPSSILGEPMRVSASTLVSRSDIQQQRIDSAIGATGEVLGVISTFAGTGQSQDAAAARADAQNKNRYLTNEYRYLQTGQR